MEVADTLILFGARLPDDISHLARLLQASNGPLVASFLEQSYELLRTEVHLLPQDTRRHFPRFSSIADLCTLHSDGQLPHALDQAFICIFQIASFIRYVNGLFGAFFAK